MVSVQRTNIFTGHRDCIYALGQGLHAHTFYTGGADGWVVEWNYAKGNDGKLLVQVGVPVYSFTLLKEAKLLLCGTRAGNLHIIDLKEGREIRNITAHSAGIFDIKELPDIGCVATAGGDGTIKIWEIGEFTLVRELAFSQKSARVIALKPGEREMAIGYSDYLIRIVSLPDFTPETELDAHTNSVFALAYSPDGNTLLSGGRDAVLKVWDAAKNYVPMETINAHWYHINCIAYNPSGTLFATASLDKTIKIWKTKTMQLIKVIDKAKYDGHTTSVNKILWIDDNRLISCSDDKTAMLWELST